MLELAANRKLSPAAARRWCGDDGFPTVSGRGSEVVAPANSGGGDGGGAWASLADVPAARGGAFGAVRELWAKYYSAMENNLVHSISELPSVREGDGVDVTSSAGGDCGGSVACSSGGGVSAKRKGWLDVCDEKQKEA
ncbi:unnamed protein product [Cochlearia groenlandica]